MLQTNHKINPRTTAKPHAHLQTLKKKSAKFHKDLAKIVGGVALKNGYNL